MKNDLTTVGNVVQAWSEVTTAAVEIGRLRVNHCILSAKVLTVALDDRGYESFVMPCAVAVANAQARKLYAEGVPLGEWPESAHSIGVDPTQPAETGGFPGHMVVVVDTDQGRYIVDGSTQQFYREGRIEIPPSIVTRADEFPDEPYASATSPDGTVIQWKALPALGKAHRSAPDWTKNWRVWLDVLYRHMHEIEPRIEGLGRGAPPNPGS